MLYFLFASQYFEWSSIENFSHKLVHYLISLENLNTDWTRVNYPKFQNYVTCRLNVPSVGIILVITPACVYTSSIVYWVLSMGHIH